MSRTITLTAAVGAALMLAVPAWGKGQQAESQLEPALDAPNSYRQQELSRANDPNLLLGQSVDPATEAVILRSKELGQAYQNDPNLFRTNGFGAYPASTVMINEARENPVSTSGRVSTITPDAFERAVAVRGTGSADHFTANDNRFRVRPVGDPVTVAATGSGTDIEWPQIGIGLGIGIALMLGLVLGLRVSRHRPLAH